MTIDTKRLRDLASKATPGEWRNGYDPSHFDAPEVTDGKTFAYYVPDANDAAFIAACSPDAVVALLDELEQLRGSAQRQSDRANSNWDSYQAAECELQAMTAARDEAVAWLMETSEPSLEAERRIAELRKVGAK